jgi:hypothetical protein
LIAEKCRDHLAKPVRKDEFEKTSLKARVEKQGVEKRRRIKRVELRALTERQRFVE